LRNSNEIGEGDLRTANLLLKYGANPNLETAEVRPLCACLLSKFSNCLCCFLGKPNMKSLLRKNYFANVHAFLENLFLVHELLKYYVNNVDVFLFISVPAGKGNASSLLRKTW
jgi:hypothetical protein